MKELKELRVLTEELNERNIKLTNNELVNLLLATIETMGDNFGTQTKKTDVGGGPTSVRKTLTIGMVGVFLFN